MEKLALKKRLIILFFFLPFEMVTKSGIPISVEKNEKNYLTVLNFADHQDYARKAFIDDTNIPHVKQATFDFISQSDYEYKILINESTNGNEHPTFWNGLMLFQKSEKKEMKLEIAINPAVNERKFTAAKEYLDKYLEMHPLDIDMLLKNAEICLEIKEYALAGKSLDKILLFHPEHPEALVIKKNLDQQQKEKDNGTF